MGINGTKAITEILKSYPELELREKTKIGFKSLKQFKLKEESGQHGIKWKKKLWPLEVEDQVSL